MYCLFELLTVACLVVFVAGILFVVCAAMRLLYRAKDPAISSYPGGRGAPRGAAEPQKVELSSAGPGANAVRPYSRRGDPGGRRASAQRRRRHSRRGNDRLFAGVLARKLWANVEA